MLIVCLLVAGCARTGVPSVPRAPQFQLDRALVVAVTNGDLAAVNRSLDDGAAPDAAGMPGVHLRGDLTPLQFALLNGRGDIAIVLARRGANVRARDKYGDTPLHAAVKKGLREAAGELIARGAVVNAQGELDDTPLHAAVYRHDDVAADLLRRHGADEAALNRYGLRPADMARVPAIETALESTAALLDDTGQWQDRRRAQTMYRGLRTLPPNELTNAVVLKVIERHDARLRILILAIKLGTDRSEEKLAALLMVYGDSSMAEDYLNSGSSELAEAARAWAEANGYSIIPGFGSHRATWGAF